MKGSKYGLFKKKVLYKFLMKKCVLYKYLYNCQKAKPQEYEEQKNRAKNSKYGMIMFFDGTFDNICSSFVWINTKEGDAFWRELDNEYYHFLSKENCDYVAMKGADVFY